MTKLIVDFCNSANSRGNFVADEGLHHNVGRKGAGKQFQTIQAYTTFGNQRANV
jgi:hypothetical protein